MVHLLIPHGSSDAATPKTLPAFTRQPAVVTDTAGFGGALQFLVGLSVLHGSTWTSHGIARTTNR
jgi:hypothetical protein